jgi:hypothetical protein
VSINISSKPSKGRQQQQAAVGWTSGFGHPTSDQVADPSTLFHIPPADQADYWRLAADPRAVEQLIRRAGVHHDQGNRNAEVAAWARSHGLVPGTDTLRGPEPSVDTIAATTIRMLDKDGITETGLLEHIVIAREAAFLTRRRATSAVDSADWDNRHRCVCCGRPDGTTRRRMRSAPHFPDGCPTAVLTEMICEPCHGQAIQILTEQAGNRATVAAWLAKQ